MTAHLRTVVLVAAVTASAWADGGSIQTPAADALIIAKDHNAAMQAASEALAFRRELARSMVKILQSSREPFELLDRRPSAIQIAEEYGMEEAIEPLIALIHLRAVFPTGTEYPTPFGRDYPAAGALVAIGKPAARPCIQALARTDNPIRRRHLVWVLVNIVDEACAKRWIEDAITEPVRDEAKVRLQAAIDAISADQPLTP